MIIEKTFIGGLYEIFTPMYDDNRGYLFESYLINEYKLPSFVHELVSVSNENVIRGLHYQIGDDAQGKLCQVLHGFALDIVVDIRPGSKTFGKHFSTILGEMKFFDGQLTIKQLWVPPGMAHGFKALQEYTVFHYKCTHARVAESERALLYNDPDLNIDWELGYTYPILSDKDKRGHLFKELI